MFEWFGRVSFCSATKVAEFASHLRDGRIVGSRCRGCGAESFPPRADCAACLSGEYEFFEVSGRGRLATFTRIHAAPAGFEDLSPFTLGVADLEETGRLLAAIGTTIGPEEIRIGMPVQAVPRLFEDLPEIRVHYTLEKPGTPWVKSGPLGEGGAW